MIKVVNWQVRLIDLTASAAAMQEATTQPGGKGIDRPCRRHRMRARRAAAVWQAVGRERTPPLPMPHCLCSCFPRPAAERRQAPQAGADSGHHAGAQGQAGPSRDGLGRSGQSRKSSCRHPELPGRCPPALLHRAVPAKNLQERAGQPLGGQVPQGGRWRRLFVTFCSACLRTAPLADVALWPLCCAAGRRASRCALHNWCRLPLPQIRITNATFGRHVRDAPGGEEFMHAAGWRVKASGTVGVRALVLFEGLGAHGMTGCCCADPRSGWEVPSTACAAAQPAKPCAGRSAVSRPSEQRAWCAPPLAGR